MTRITSTKDRDFTFLALGSSFVGIRYRSHTVSEKIIENTNVKPNGESNVKYAKGKSNRKNVKCEIGNKNRIDTKSVNANREMKIENGKLNAKGKWKNYRKIGIEIAKNVILIGSALSGLLPTIRHSLVMRTVV